MMAPHWNMSPHGNRRRGMSLKSNPMGMHLIPFSGTKIYLILGKSAISTLYIVAFSLSSSEAYLIHPQRNYRLTFHNFITVFRILFHTSYDSSCTYQDSIWGTDYKGAIGKLACTETELAIISDSFFCPTTKIQLFFGD